MRNSYLEASCTLSVDDEAAMLLASELAKGWPRLHIYRRSNGANDAALVFNGHLAPITATAEVGSTLTITARSPFARLLGGGSGGGRFSVGGVYTAQDAGSIVDGLLVETNFAGDTGLAIGNVEPTRLRDLTHPFGQSIGEAIVNLSAMLDGFDFRERFVYTATAPTAPMAHLDIYASLGVDQPGARFEYGEDTLANLRAVGVTIAQPVNIVQLSGAHGLAAYVTDSASVLTYGAWPIFKSFPSISVQSTLDARAAALLRPRPVKTYAMTPDPTAPKPWDDFYLGDTGHLHIDRGALQETTAVRINAFTVVVDDDGLESAEIPDPRSPDEEDTLHAAVEVEVTAP